MFKTSLLLFLVIEMSYQECTNFFPKTIGAIDGHTTIYDIDVYKETIYACGETNSTLLKGYAGIS